MSRTDKILFGMVLTVGIGIWVFAIWIRIRYDWAEIPQTSNLLMVFGSIFALVGGIGFYTGIRKQLKRRKFLDTHELHYVTIDEVEEVTEFARNDRCPYIVHCSLADANGNVHRYKSLLTFDEINYANPEGTKVKLYVNPDNYKDYYVDLEGKYNEKRR